MRWMHKHRLAIHHLLNQLKKTDIGNQSFSTAQHNNTCSPSQSRAIIGTYFGKCTPIYLHTVVTRLSQMLSEKKLERHAWKQRPPFALGCWKAMACSHHSVKTFPTRPYLGSTTCCCFAWLMMRWWVVDIVSQSTPPLNVWPYFISRYSTLLAAHVANTPWFRSLRPSVSGSQDWESTDLERETQNVKLSNIAKLGNVTRSKSPISSLKRRFLYESR